MANLTASSSSSSSSSALPAPCEKQIVLAAPSSSGAVDDAFEDGCSICLEPFSTEDPATVTSCKHEYHLQCILEWSQRSKECPICWQLFVLKDPASQELLAAVESERLSKSRKISPSASTAAHHFHEEDCFYVDDSDFDERLMQHLAAAASRARHYRRRLRQRPSEVDDPQAIDSLINIPGVQPRNLTSPDHGHVSSDSGSPTSDSQPTVNVQPSSVPHAAVNRDTSFKPRLLFGQTPPDSPSRGNSSEVFSFSDSIKSKWSAASARYKESISRGTRGLKEKLLARNNPVKELSKEVQREVSVGIAGVAKMIERLDLASKRTGASAPDSSSPVGTSSTIFKGKGVQQHAVRTTPDVSLDAKHGRLEE